MQEKDELGIAAAGIRAAAVAEGRASERRRLRGADQSAGERTPVFELLRGVALDQKVAVVESLEVNLDHVGT
jgi:hypothetical protein